MFKPVAVIACDAYKLGHHSMYPAGTTKSYANLTPRSLKHSPIPSKYDDGKIVVFGSQFSLHELHDLWDETFFSKPWHDIAYELNSFTVPFVGDAGFEAGLANFKSLHSLGYLPLHFKALPEGSVVDVKIPVLTVANTLPEFYWLVGYIETYLSQESWKMPTVATIARAYRTILTKYATETGVHPDFINVQAHDFSARGLSGAHDNAMVGASHLTSFIGTDSLLGVQLINEYYFGRDTLVGVSVPATEHSIMTATGNTDVPVTVGRTITEEITTLKEEFPKFYELAMSFIDATEANKGTKEYSSKDTDGSTQIYVYMTVIDGRIVSLGEERIRDGGIYWTERTSKTTTTSAPKVNSELLMFKRLINELYPSGIVSIVADSYDFWKVITEFTVELKDDILNRERDSLGFSKVVFRPDSGDPADILCGTAIPVTSIKELNELVLANHKEDGYRYYTLDGKYFMAYKRRGKQGWKVELMQFEDYDVTPEMKGAVQCLYEVFGGTTNELGFTHLCDRVGLIYGDSITMNRADDILSRLKAKGFASDCVVLGIGSYSYQYVTRDTFGYAMKSTYQERNGVGFNIFKDPATDDGTKKSATGLLRVDLVDGNFELTDKATPEQESGGELKTIYRDGKFYNKTTIEQIRSKLIS